MSNSDGKQASGTREEILDHYAVHRWEDEGGFVLVFNEGGQKTVVSRYFSTEDAIDFAEEDSLMHWTNILKRVWED